MAPSAALGLDRLPPAESAELAAAWLDGALALPAPFRAWAMAGTAAPEPAALQAALDRGAVGLEVAADAARRARTAWTASRRCSRVLDAARRPLLVHPGPAGAENAPGRPAGGRPSCPTSPSSTPPGGRGPTRGRDRFPALPVCFVALAGLGPLHAERHRARGGTGRPVDPLAFVETSSYGTQAVDAVDPRARHRRRLPRLGPPVRRGRRCPRSATPPLHAIRTSNPGRLLAHVPQEVSA